VRAGRAAPDHAPAARRSPARARRARGRGPGRHADRRAVRRYRAALAQVLSALRATPRLHPDAPESTAIRGDPRVRRLARGRRHTIMMDMNGFAETSYPSPASRIAPMAVLVFGLVASGCDAGPGAGPESPGEHDAGAPALTYHRDTRAIIEVRCAGCHRA